MTSTLDKRRFLVEGLDDATVAFVLGALRERLAVRVVHVTEKNKVNH